MIIAIDGPAGSGKSTIARMIAEGFGFTYVNSSGNIYRAMTLRALRAGADTSDAGAVVALARGARIEYKGGRLDLDGADVEAELHGAKVDALVAQLSAISRAQVDSEWTR